MQVSGREHDGDAFGESELCVCFCFMEEVEKKMIGRLMHAQAAFRRKEKCGCYRGVEMKLNWTTFGQPQQPVGGRTRNGIHLMLFEKQTYNTERRVLKRRTMLREPRQDNMPARCCCSRCSSAVCLSVCLR